MVDVVASLGRHVTHVEPELAICLDVIFILTIAVKYLGRGFLDTICCTNIPKERHATFEGPATDKEDIITIEVKD